MHKWFVYKDLEQAAIAAAIYMADIIKKTLKEKDICYIALPGGNTPKHCLSYLAEKDLAWKKVHWYLGDERCFPKGHKERNDVMLEQYLWSKISATHIYPIRTELGAEQAAKLYRETIAPIKQFDIVFLGIGDDGHTASLFPGNDALNDKRTVIPVYNSPKNPSERVSLSVGTLRHALNRIVLATGKEKSTIIKRIKNAEDLPINSLGDVNWFVDEDAFS